MCRFYFGLPGNDCIQDPKTAQEVGRRRRPTSSAVFSSFVQLFPGSPKYKIHPVHILSVSTEHGTYFLRPKYVHVSKKNKNVPWDILNMCIFYFGLPGNDSTKVGNTQETVDE